MYIKVKAKHIISIVLISIAASSASFADSWLPAIGVQAGTLGAGVSISQPISNHFNLRANLNGFKYSYNNTLKAIDYNFKLNWLNSGLLLDYHPFSNGLYLTGGAYYNANKATFKAKLNGEQQIVIGGQTFNSGDIGSGGINGKVNFNKYSPYLGIGFAANNKAAKGFMFMSEIGILFTGTPKLSYNIDCNASAIVSSLDPNICNELHNASNTEKASIDKNLNKVKVYPVIYLGLAYKF